MNKIEQAHLRVDNYPLLIDDTIVQFKELYVKEFDSSTLSSLYKKIAYPSGSGVY